MAAGRSVREVRAPDRNPGVLQDSRDAPEKNTLLAANPGTAADLKEQTAGPAIPRVWGGSA
ncbi:hypothetical protein GCM10009595_08630 [Falsarthrobacter nasiphocae]